jgi:hypothetical protein
VDRSTSVETRTIQGTQSHHCFIFTGGKVRIRPMSCFCDKCRQDNYGECDSKVFAGTLREVQLEKPTTNARRKRRRTRNDDDDEDYTCGFTVWQEGENAAPLLQQIKAGRAQRTPGLLDTCHAVISPDAPHANASETVEWDFMLLRVTREPYSLLKEETDAWGVTTAVGTEVVQGYFYELVIGGDGTPLGQEQRRYTYNNRDMAIVPTTFITKFGFRMEQEDGEYVLPEESHDAALNSVQ